MYNKFQRDAPSTGGSSAQEGGERPEIQGVTPGEEEKNSLYIWDGINSELEEVESVAEAQQWVKDNLTDAEEGIHPDAESVYLFQQIGTVEVKPVEGKDTFTIKMNVHGIQRSLTEQIKELTALQKKNRIKEADMAYMLGVHFGYPHCCIKNFCEDLLNGKHPGKERNVNGSGFIPCKKHIEQIRSAEISIDSLIDKSAPALIAAAPSMAAENKVLREECERLRHELKIVNAELHGTTARNNLK